MQRSADHKYRLNSLARAIWLRFDGLVVGDLGQFYAQGAAVNMSSRVSKILAAASVSIGLTSICHGEERHSNRGPNTVYSFGNWRIDAVKENQSLQLFGTGDGAYFDIQCFAVGNDLAVHVPLFEKAEVASIRGLRVQVIAWNESGAPITVPMPAWKNVLAVTIAKSSDGRGDELELGAQRFIEKVFDSKTFFALTAGGSTRTYEAAHVPAARDVFRRSCAEINENYDGFLALHPVNP
jgi:hypothetical protein